jgi:nicotinamidase-related amidase
LSDLHDDYAKAGFGGSLDFGTAPALVIVDMALAYIEPGAPLYIDAPSLIPNIAALASAARAAGAPVIFTRVEYQAGVAGADGGYFYRKVKALRCFDAGNRLGDFDPRLAPQQGDMVLTKQYPSAFFATHLASTLTALKVDTVIVTGVSTSGCVRATALDALCHGFVPFVPRDACADRSAAVHEGNLFDLQAKYAEVVSTVDVVERLKAGSSPARG